MKTPGFRKVLLTGLFVLGCLAIAFGLVNRRGQPAAPGGVFSLKAPPFVGVARAESSGADVGIASFLDSEAGISAYFQAPGSITLSTVRSLYRTIETETAQYIIGSIAVPNYSESEDVHVYIHTNGWVLAYYLKADATGKIFDWRSYTGGTTIPTKLENVLAIVAAQIGAPAPSITFYHFQYPNANNLMLIAEASSSYSGDTFEVNLTGSYGYYERSWSFGGSGAGYYLLDNVEITHKGNGWDTSQGTLTAAQLLPDTFHIVMVTDINIGTNGGLALVYRIP